MEFSSACLIGRVTIVATYRCAWCRKISRGRWPAQFAGSHKHAALPLSQSKPIKTHRRSLTRKTYLRMGWMSLVLFQIVLAANQMLTTLTLSVFCWMRCRTKLAICQIFCSIKSATQSSQSKKSYRMKGRRMRKVRIKRTDLSISERWTPLN